MTKKRNRIKILLTLMRTHGIEILSVQEPHFSWPQDIASLDGLLGERDCHRIACRIGGTITTDRGGGDPHSLQTMACNVVRTVTAAHIDCESGVNPIND